MCAKHIALVVAALAVLLVFEPSRAVIINSAQWILASNFRIFVSLLTSAVVVLLYHKLGEGDWRGGWTGLLTQKDAVVAPSAVGAEYASYESHFGTRSRTGDAEHEKLIEKRQKKYMEMVQNFYNLVTDFYEYGWGDCFHFAPRFIGEEFQESLRRTEYFLASRIGLNSTTHALDVGCGVGGPMRNVARFSGSKVTGANISDYQIKVGNKRNKAEHLADMCTLVKADFMNLPMQDNTFDGAYAIEATCHAPDKVGCFAEVFRTLKPGGLFAGLEWIVTDKYDAKNKKHFAIREGIEVGNGLPVLATAEKVLDSLRKAGFEIVEAYDHERVVHQPGQIPWYEALGGTYTLKGFRRTKPGRSVTQVIVTILEAMRIAPKGTTKVSALLNATADDLYDGGKLEIFTPSYYFLARKPLK